MAVEAFVKWILTNKPDIKNLQKAAFDNLMHQELTHTAQTGRVAQYFALMQVAGEIAKQAGLLHDFNPQETVTAIYYKHWHRYNQVKRETIQYTDLLREAIDGNGFIIFDSAPYADNNKVVGFYKVIKDTEEDQTEYYLLASRIRRLFGIHNPVKIKTTLTELKILPANSKNIRLPFMGGKCTKVYMINKNELDSFYNKLSLNH